MIFCVSCYFCIDLLQSLYFVFFYMSNNSSLVQKNPIHIFFSPPKPKTTDLKRREDNFVLDCTNPLRSKLQLYQHDEDHYN